MARSSAPSPSATFPHAQELARLIEAFDWTDTAVGSPDEWPATLRTAVDLILGSRFPMMLGWGPDLRLIYNDGYIPILGEKHPIIWRRARDEFEEIWETVGPLLEGVYQSGESVRRDSFLLPLDRHGFVEECYFSFSYSPIRTPDGAVAGVLSAAVETTETLLRSRRERTLHQVSISSGSLSPRDAVTEACESLEAANADIPFLAAFLRDTDGRLEPVYLRGVSSEGDNAVANAVPTGWEPSAGIRVGEPVTRISVSDLAPIRVETGAAAEHAVLLPISAEPGGGRADPPGLLILGTSARLPWDDTYQGFLRMVGERISAAHDAARLREIRIAEAEDRYRQLFDEALDGILLGSEPGQLFAANPSSCEILGLSESEILAKGRAIIDPADPRSEQAIRVWEETGEFRGELCFLNAAGESIPCEVASRRYRSPGGKARTVIIFRDIRERLALERRLGEARRMEAVGRLAGGIAHDFNNLLTVIDAQVAFLRETLADMPEPSAELEVLSDTSRRAATLTRRLLDFARRSHDEPEVFDPGSEVVQLSLLLRRLVGSDCELAYDIADGLPNVRMSPHQLEQILFNLVGNARDAIEAKGEPGRIEVSIRHDEDGFLKLSVRDTGTGIPEEDLPQIFESFYTTKEHGSGIGLSTVRLIVEDLNGTVSVNTRTGRGTTFTVRLPTTEERPTIDAVPAAGHVHAVPGASILLVEDHARLRGMLARCLDRAGYEVQTAAHGEEALRICDEWTPDLLVTDIVMPLLSGTELARTLLERWPGLHVLLMSGYTEEEIGPGDRLASARFLSKPFRPEALLRAVAEILGDGEEAG